MITDTTAPQSTPQPAAATPPAAAPAAPVQTIDTPSTGSLPTQPSPELAPQEARQPRRGGLIGVLDAVTDMLAKRDTTQISYDDQGKHVTPGKPLTRGQQIAQIALTGLTGAARAAAAPPGPGHVQQGAAAATLGAMNDVNAAADKQDATAQEAYQAQQKAKMNAITYQLGIRQIAKNDLELKAAGVKAEHEALTFSDTQIDREKALGSYDLGLVKDAGQIADVISSLPNWQQQLYQHEGIQPHPVYAEDGTRLGLQLYLRKPDTDRQAAPEGTKVPKLVPGAKPGEPARTEYFTPAGATNGDIDKYNRAYLADLQNAQKQQADAAKSAATTRNLDAEAGAHKASAANSYAEANKNNAEANKLSTPSPDDPQVMQIGEQIAKGGLTEDQVPGFSKLKPAIEAYLSQHHPNLDQTSVFLTGEQRKRKDLANNAVHNLDDIATRLQRRPDLVGKIQGLVTQGKEVVGTDDRDLGDIVLALDNYALASTGAHGIRAVQARVDAKKAFLNNFKNGPNAVDAAVQAARASLHNLAQAGKPKGIDGSAYVYDAKPAGSPAAAHAAAVSAPASKGTFSPSAWKAANPKGDVNAAIAAAKSQNYQIGQ